MCGERGGGECGRGGGMWEGVRCVVRGVEVSVGGVEVCGKELGVWEGVEVCGRGKVCGGRGRGVWEG